MKAVQPPPVKQAVNRGLLWSPFTTPTPHPHPGPLPSPPCSHQPTAHSLPPSPTFTCSWSYRGAYLWQWLGVQVGRALEPVCYCLETVAVLWRSCVLPHSVQRMVNYSLWWILGGKKSFTLRSFLVWFVNLTACLWKEHVC